MTWLVGMIVLRLNDADIDFTGSVMPPPGSAPSLSIDEKMLFARWIDLGAPINESAAGAAAFGWDRDEQKPTATMSIPTVGRNPPTNLFRFGFFDADSGINLSSLSLRANFSVNGIPAGTELAGLTITSAPWVRELQLTSQLAGLTNAELRLSVRDQQGNETLIVRRFSVAAIGEILAIDLARPRNRR